MGDTGRALADFAGACRARGLSVTHQRLAVYETVLASRSHPDAEEILGIVRARIPTISRGTVYRTLETLCDLGLVSDVGRLRGSARFEASLEPHHHLVCLGCRRILDLHDPSLDRIPMPPGRGRTRRVANGFEVTGYQIQFVGYCRGCRTGRRPAAVRTQRKSKGGEAWPRSSRAPRLTRT